MVEQRDGVHTIPVPRGWTPEQAWEAVRRGDLLTDPEPAWANVLIEGGLFVKLQQDNSPYMKALKAQTGHVALETEVKRLTERVERLQRALQLVPNYHDISVGAIVFLQEALREHDEAA